MPARFSLPPNCPDPERTLQTINALAAACPGCIPTSNTDSFEALARVIGISPHLADLMQRHPDWIAGVFSPNNLSFPRRIEGLRRDVTTFLAPLLDAAEHPHAWRELRLFKERQQLCIAIRDIHGLGSLEEITRELSDLADVCLDGALRIATNLISARFGQPWHQDASGNWLLTPFCVLGVGKLGGQELNYSSDVDLLFVYSDEGHVFRNPPGIRTKPPLAGLTSHQYFRRIVEAIVAGMTSPESDGPLYRVDLRLRPEGDVGPLARSLEGYENYYAQWGQTWERLMLQKARTVAGDEELGAEFIETIQSFRYPRFVSERLIHEVAATKQRLEREVVEGDAERDVKRGRGGIREIEFIVQSLQLLHGGRQPFLQCSNTLTALAKLASYDLIPSHDASQLAHAYRFLRNVEHRLQMEHNRQTHALPPDPAARLRLGLQLGFSSLEDFEHKRYTFVTSVRQTYDIFLPSNHREQPSTSIDLPTFEPVDREKWLPLLDQLGFLDPDKAWRLLRQFVHGPEWAHVSHRTEDLGRTLLPRFFALCKGSPWSPPQPGPLPGVLSDPDRVLTRIDSFVSAYGTRTPLYEAWGSHPQFFELLIWLFDRSEYLAELAIRVPDLVEELVLSGRLRRSKSTAEILTELGFGSGDTDQRLWIRRYHQAEQTRIGLRSILELGNPEQISLELSDLADACILYALDVVQRRHRWKSPPFLPLAMGKLGGRELNFGSDLDLIFVTTSSPRQIESRHKAAAEFIDLLAGATELGSSYDIDTRLRPDGDDGPLVNTTAGLLKYYERRAQLWEVQALSRCRSIQGQNSSPESRLTTRLHDLCNFHSGNPVVAAYHDDWIADLRHMLQRIQEERTPHGSESHAIKTGKGGLVEAEFLAQFWCLSQGWHEPNTSRALQRGIDSTLLPHDLGLALMDGHRTLYRIESILRRWSFHAEVSLPHEPTPRRRVALRCGFDSTSALDEAVDKARKAIHDAARHAGIAPGSDSAAPIKHADKSRLQPS